MDIGLCSTNIQNTLTGSSNTSKTTMVILKFIGCCSIEAVCENELKKTGSTNPF